MSEVHTTITGKNNEVNVVFHNPGAAPLPTNAGQAIVAAAKTPGNPNGNVQGQTAGVVISNPA